MCACKCLPANNYTPKRRVEFHEQHNTKVAVFYWLHLLYKMTSVNFWVIECAKHVRLQCLNNSYFARRRWRFHFISFRASKNLCPHTQKKERNSTNELLTAIQLYFQPPIYEWAFWLGCLYVMLVAQIEELVEWNYLWYTLKISRLLLSAMGLCYVELYFCKIKNGAFCARKCHLSLTSPFLLFMLYSFLSPPSCVNAIYVLLQYFYFVFLCYGIRWWWIDFWGLRLTICTALGFSRQTEINFLTKSDENPPEDTEITQKMKKF